MDKDNHTTSDNVQAFLNANIEKFAEYAKLVIHDNDFLKCVYELLPFEGMVCASMNVVSPNHVVRKMGIGVMRIDIDPSLFSLAVIMTTNRSGKEEEYTVFINVSEGIENLQNYISSRHFQEEVVNTKFTSN